MAMKVDLSGKHALVTGSSSGIGRAIAITLGECGAAVCVNCRTSVDEARAVADEINAGPGSAIIVQADIGERNDVERLFRTLDDEWNGLDICICNAGIESEEKKSIWEADVEEWEKIIRVNLTGCFLCCRAAARRMIAQRSGVIVGISSVHELIAWTGQGAYCVSKAGMAMLLKTLAQEAAPHNVRVISIAPGAIRTPINRNVWDDPKGLRELQEKIPLNRIGEPEEVARFVAALVSDIGSYVTGTTFFVDGGMTNYPSFAHGG